MSKDKPEPTPESIVERILFGKGGSKADYAKDIESYKDLCVKKACKELREEEDKLHFMIDNGLGWKDMENDNKH